MSCFPLLFMAVFLSPDSSSMFSLPGSVCEHSVAANPPSHTCPRGVCSVPLGLAALVTVLGQQNRICRVCSRSHISLGKSYSRCNGLATAAARSAARRGIPECWGGWEQCTDPECWGGWAQAWGLLHCPDVTQLEPEVLQIMGMRSEREPSVINHLVICFVDFLGFLFHWCSILGKEGMG